MQERVSESTLINIKPKSAQLSCDNIAVPLDHSFNGCGRAIEKFLSDSFEAVIAEVLELALFDEGESGRAVVGLLGCGVVVVHLTFDVTDTLHYFNINFIYLPAFHTKVYNRLIISIKMERIGKEFKSFDFIAYAHPFQNNNYIPYEGHCSFDGDGSSVRPIRPTRFR